MTFTTYSFRWIGLNGGRACIRERLTALRARMEPVSNECEDGTVSVYDPTLDVVGEQINFPRRRHEGCQSYQIRMQVFLQEEVLLRDRYDDLLKRLLETDRR